MTSFEQMLRDTLTEGGSRAPRADHLAEAVATRIQRDRRRHWQTAGAAFATLAIVGGATAMLNVAGNAPHAGSGSSPGRLTAAHTPASLEQALIGTWGLTAVGPQPGAARSGSMQSSAYVTFRTDNTYLAGDGINNSVGTYRAFDDGNLRFTLGPWTDAGCGGCGPTAPVPRWLQDTHSAVVNGTALVLRDGDGNPIVTLTRRSSR